MFLTPLSRDLHTSVGRLGVLLGTAELVGLSTALIGRSLDRGHYRRFVTIGALLVTFGVLAMAFSRSPLPFALGFSAVAMGVSWYTTASHSWLGRDVPYEQRGRAIGVYETSWAIALLLGVPVVGVLLSLGRWWLAFAVLGAGCALATVFVRRALPRDRSAADALPQTHRLRGLTRRATLVLVGSFAITSAAVSVFAVYGSWLQDRFGLSTRVLGVLTIAIGVAELVASGATVRLTDRVGKVVAVRRGIAVMAVGVLAVIAGPGRPALAIAALVLVFLGFEFGFVSLLAVVSEVGGTQAGAVVAVDHALTTMSRAGAAALSAALYDAHGIVAPGVVSLVGALTCAASLTLSRQQ